MWQYHQSTGQIFYGDQLVGTGYAGRDADKNIPADQGVPNEGPLPQGIYTIGGAYTDPHLGPLVMRLTPDPSNEMFGRSGFFIHADSVVHPGQASEGCIVMPQSVRIAISIHPDRQLQVVA
jgi:type VI secretion system (T6SS) effector TldE1-like protein